jgi:hypothetical protein
MQGGALAQGAMPPPPARIPQGAMPPPPARIPQLAQGAMPPPPARIPQPAPSPPPAAAADPAPPSHWQGVDSQQLAAERGACRGEPAAAGPAPGETGASDASGVPEAELPRNWKAVPSQSRPGQFSYVHVPTGLKQSRVPTGEPSEEAVEAFRDAVATAKRKVAAVCCNVPASKRLSPVLV